MDRFEPCRKPECSMQQEDIAMERRGAGWKPDVGTGNVSRSFFGAPLILPINKENAGNED